MWEEKAAHTDHRLINKHFNSWTSFATPFSLTLMWKLLYDVPWVRGSETLESWTWPWPCQQCTFTQNFLCFLQVHLPGSHPKRVLWKLFSGTGLKETPGQRNQLVDFIIDEQYQRRWGGKWGVVGMPEKRGLESDNMWEVKWAELTWYLIGSEERESRMRL